MPEAYATPDTAGQIYLPQAYRLPEGTERGSRCAHLPRCVFIEVTNRCNLLCDHCPRTFYIYEPPKTLTFEEFADIVVQFPAMERAVLHGIGEPLLNRDLARMIRHLKARGVKVLFNSNATLLTPKWQEALALSGLDEFRVSLDSADPETFLRIRGKPLLGQAVENLKAFVMTRARLGLDTPQISIWCVGMKENIDEMPDLIRLAAEIGVPEVYLQRLVYFEDEGARQGVARAEQRIFYHSNEQEEAVIAECERLSEELGVRFRASGATTPRNSLAAASRTEAHPWTACLRPWTTAYITANGNTLPCCISPFATNDYQSLQLGNVFEQPFSEIWNNERYRTWRRRLLSDSPNQACVGCGVNWSL